MTTPKAQKIGTGGSRDFRHGGPKIRHGGVASFPIGRWLYGTTTPAVETLNRLAHRAGVYYPVGIGRRREWTEPECIALWIAHELAEPLPAIACVLHAYESGTRPDWLLLDPQLGTAWCITGTASQCWKTARTVDVIQIVRLADLWRGLDALFAVPSAPRNSRAEPTNPRAAPAAR